MPNSSSPRPILKRSASTHTPPAYAPHRHPPLAHAAVHFPPSPTLTRTFTVHSPTTYDRSPIVVGPNSCALPERGGRTYTLDDESVSDNANALLANSRRLLNDHRHPRAFGRGSYTHADSTAIGHQYTPTPIQLQAPPYPPSMLPPLIADCSSSSSSCSESEESDGVHSPPSDFRTVNSIHGLAIPIPSKGPKSSQGQMYNTELSPSTPMPLSFLPHPPSPEDRSSSRRRRRPSPSPPNVEHGFGTSPKSSMRSRSAMKIPPSSSFALCSSMSGLGLDDSDSGCLGGF